MVHDNQVCPLAYRARNKTAADKEKEEEEKEGEEDKDVVTEAVEAGVEVVVTAGEKAANQVKAVATSGATAAGGAAVAAVTGGAVCERSAASLSNEELQVRAAKILLSHSL
jgi:hypothetical protein